jgi:hypothetical protein
MIPHCESRLKIVQSEKVGENTAEPEVVLMEREELKVSALELQLIGKNFVSLLASNLLSKNVSCVSHETNMWTYTLLIFHDSFIGLSQGCRSVILEIHNSVHVTKCLRNRKECRIAASSTETEVQMKKYKQILRKMSYKRHNYK